MPRHRSITLSVELIVEAALRLVDQSGDFSFPKIARELGVSQSSLYNRITGREHIIELLRARIFSAYPVPPTHDMMWDEALRVLIRGYRDCFSLHPNLVSLLMTQTVRAPEVIGLYDELAHALERSGLAEDQIAPALSMIDYIALGAALEFNAPEEVWAPPPNLYPALSRAVRHDSLTAQRIERAFDFSLDMLITGIATRAKQEIN